MDVWKIKTITKTIQHFFVSANPCSPRRKARLLEGILSLWSMEAVQTQNNLAGKFFKRIDCVRYPP
jgi:hypothetical protein